jgi:hypothetical protein
MTDEQEQEEKNYNTKTKGRRITLSIPDRTYMDMLIKIRHENLTWKGFFSILIKGFLDDDIGVMEYIDKEMSDKRAKRRSKILKKERKDVQEVVKKFGLDEEDIENIYDILEEEIDV